MRRQSATLQSTQNLDSIEQYHSFHHCSKWGKMYRILCVLICLLSTAGVAIFCIMHFGSETDYTFPINYQLKKIEIKQNGSNILAVLDASDMRCIKNQNSKPLFCALSTSNQISALRNGNVSINVHWSQDNDAKEVLIPVQTRNVSQYVTIHLFFDYYKQKLRIIPLVQSNTLNVRTKPMGISNAGNTCYMNSLIQSLIATPALRNAVSRYHNDGVNIDIQSDLFLEMMKSYLNADFKDIINSNNYQYYIIVLVDMCKFRRDSMQDSLEAWWGCFYHRFPVLKRIFSTQYRDISKNLSRHMSMIYANMPIKSNTAPNGTKNIQDCRPSLLFPDYVSIVNSQFTHSLPPGLIVGSQRRAQNSPDRKAKHLITYDIGKYKLMTGTDCNEYSLIAKIRWIGSHYWAFTYWNNQWFECNDAIIKPLSSNTVSITKNAMDFGFFYNKL